MQAKRQKSGAVRVLQSAAKRNVYPMLRVPHPPRICCIALGWFSPFSYHCQRLSTELRCISRVPLLKFLNKILNEMSEKWHLASI